MPLSLSHHIDCMEFMSKRRPTSFDLVCADPPYGIGESSKNHKSRNTPVRQKNGNIKKCPQPSYGNDTWDDAPPGDDFFYEIWRMSENRIIWGANYFYQIVDEPFKPPRRREYDAFIKKYPTGWIIWDKVNGDSDFSDCELAWTSYDRPTVVFYFMWAGMMQGIDMYQGTTMQGNKALNEKRIHPTQKPMQLYRWLYTQYKPKSTLSTHMGSQSDRIVAFKMGIDFEGCETSDRHYADGNRRFKNLTYEPLFNK